MTERRFQDIWKEQCEAAHVVRDQHGVVSALDYLIGEKLMTYAETAVGRPEFARDISGIGEWPEKAKTLAPTLGVRDFFCGGPRVRDPGGVGASVVRMVQGGRGYGTY